MPRRQGKRGATSCPTAVFGRIPLIVNLLRERARRATDDGAIQACTKTFNVSLNRQVLAAPLKVVAGSCRVLVDFAEGAGGVAESAV